MRTLFIIPLLLLSLVSFPSWAVTFKDGKISSESVILENCRSDYKHNCVGTETNAFGTYKGEFQHNLRHGQGEWTLQDGTTYVGIFSDGFNLNGKAYYKNGDVWIGSFVDEHYAAGHVNAIGEVTINYPDGSKYVGSTQGGERHGNGTFTAKDGQVETGLFEYGQLVDSNASSSGTEKNTKSATVSAGSDKFAHSDDDTVCFNSRWDKAAVSEAKKRRLNCNVREAQAKPPAAVNRATNDDASFWSKTDQFLGMIADGISKKDAITGLRTLDSPFHNEDHYRKQGQQTLDLIKKKARSDGVKIFSSNEPEYQRVKRIVDRLVDASHYRNHKDKVQYAVIDYEDFNALAFGGGYFVVFTGLMKQTNDDELAYVIAHELAHNTAGHIEESFFLKVKDVFGDKPTNAYSTSYTNIKEQEADRIAIVYAALAGYDPRASATIWERQYQGIEQYAFYRSHPANPQRVQANRYASNLVMKHFTRGVVSQNVDKVLKCNELFCNTPMSEIAKDGSGGGVIKTLEVLGDYYLKNKQAKEEKKRQAQEIAQAQILLAKKKLETPPNVNWTAGWNVFRGTIERHNQKAGLNFGIANGRGEFYYNFNDQVQKGILQFSSQDNNGYWFMWQDNWGEGRLLLKEYTDGSMRVQLSGNDGANPSRLLGEFAGFR